MNKEITIDKAIKTWSYLLTSMIVVGTIILYFYALVFVAFPLWLAITICSFATVVFVVLIYSAINKWRFWVFTNVQNVHELKKRTEMTGIISKDNKFYKKIETEEKYSNIRLRFAQDYTFIDDKTIPNETIIYYSKIRSRVLMVICLPFFLLGLFFLIANDMNNTLKVVGVFLLLISIFRFFKEYTKLKGREPQIILSHKGIKIKAGFHKWEEIEGEKIEFSGGTKKETQYYLAYRHPRGKEMINFTDFDINPARLSKLLVLYRERSKLQK